MYGYYQFTGSMGANTLTSGLRGPNNIKFADGTHIRYNTCDFKLGGTVMGERSIEAYGTVVYEDLTHGLRAIVTFSTHVKSGYVFRSTSGCKDEIVGTIYQSSQKPMQPTEFGAT